MIDNFWLGLRVQNDTWNWQDSAPFSYSNWMEGNPDKRTPTEECVSVRIFFICYHLNDGLQA